MVSFNLNEQTSSHVSALQLLRKMGYQHLTTQEALNLRNGGQGEALLTEVLYKWLEQHNDYEYKVENYQFSASDLQQAVNVLSRLPYTGSYPLGYDNFSRLDYQKGWYNLLGQVKESLETLHAIQ